MNKRDILMEQVRQAVAVVQRGANQSHDFGRGEYAAASMVMVELHKIIRRDESMEAEGIKRGAP